MTDKLSINLHGLSDKEAAYVLEYLRLKSLPAAALVAGINPDTLRRRLNSVGINAAARRSIELGGPYELTDLSAPPVVAQQMDVVERHRLTAETADLRKQVKTLTARLASAEDHRAGILGLVSEPLEPIFEPVTSVGDGANRQAVILHLTDLHVGETVNREEVAGVNEYNIDIAKARISRAFNTAAILTTVAWPRCDEAPSVIYIFLGGDLVSGHGLHPEHAETDAGTAYQQSKWAAAFIAGGVQHLDAQLTRHYGHPIPIVLISVVGNHGRDTFGKPRTKLVSLQSYDTLVSDFIESATNHLPHISHHRPRGFDAYVSVVGWPMLLTHGDRMSAGGGTGFIGPMANIVKGHRKIIDTEHRQRRPIYKVFSGHYHVTGVTPFGYAGGSGVGYGEFAKSIRADPEPAQQNCVVVHERMGVIRHHVIGLGTPGEGTIYEPRGGVIAPVIGG